MQDFNTSIHKQLHNRDKKQTKTHIERTQHPTNTSKIYQIGNKKDGMSIHSNEPSRPLSRQELVSWKQLLLWSVENTNLKNLKSQYTQEHEKSQTEHRQCEVKIAFIIAQKETM